MTLTAIALVMCVALSFKLWHDSASDWVEWDLKLLMRIISFFFTLVAFMLLGLEIVMWQTMIVPIL